MPRFIKKPNATVEALNVGACTINELQAFVATSKYPKRTEIFVGIGSECKTLNISTPENRIDANAEDWLVRGEGKRITIVPAADFIEQFEPAPAT